MHIRRGSACSTRQDQTHLLLRARYTSDGINNSHLPLRRFQLPCHLPWHTSLCCKILKVDKFSIAVLPN